MSSRQYSFLDQCLIAIDNGIRTLFSEPISVRPNPAKDIANEPMPLIARKKSAALMRINHTGEICAQALYYGQAMTTKSKRAKQALLNAASEEQDHLAWCQERIAELQGHTSYLNMVWYFNAFSLGLLAGMISDQWSLGFVVETERQVEQHLKRHLQEIENGDKKSRAILEQMCEDEAHHATVAMAAGAIELPDIVKKIMKLMSKIMIKTTYYI